MEVGHSTQLFSHLSSFTITILCAPDPVIYFPLLIVIIVIIIMSFLADWGQITEKK